LPDTLRAVRVHGTVCFTGMLSNQMDGADFYPIRLLPDGVRLTVVFGGTPGTCRRRALQEFLDSG
jgi:hypothetical protein